MNTPGSDFLFSNLGTAPRESKNRKSKIKPGDGDYIAPEEIEAVVRGAGDDAKRTRKVMTGVLGGLESIKTSGLTAELLVIMVENKCAYADNRNPISRSTVRKVLEALFKIHEYVR